ncbi:hypothetical protein GO497_18185 [Acidovorax citrulli]|nr:hypothetical protein [Paracidovorax citrulli]
MTGRARRPRPESLRPHVHGVGVAFAIGATNYSVGTGARMGPGYSSLILGILLAILVRRIPLHD